MNCRRISRIFSLVIILNLLALPVFSQVDQPAASTENPEATPIVKEESEGPKELSIYGEAQGVNADSNSVAVQYYDYDSDEEKNIELILDKDAKIDGASGINDIKSGSWVDVSYEVKDGKNIVKAISVETEEEFLADEGGIEETEAKQPEAAQ